MDKPMILIVDDEPNNHRVYERILEPLNLDITRAMSGQQALEVAHQNDFFLILMDVQMPNMDGFETAELILGHPKTKHIPVIFITAIAKDESFEFKGYQSGAVDYMVKPINDNILICKVTIFLDLYHSKRQLQKAKEDLQLKNKELSSYDHMVAHDLKAPLRGISTLIGFLEDDLGNNLTGEIKESFEAIKQKAIQGNDLINGILAFSDASRIYDLKEPMKLIECINSAVLMVETIIDDKHAEISIEEFSDEANCVPIKVQQLFQNLIANALKFHESDSTPKIKIFRTQHDTTGVVEICVEDNGIGFSSEKASEIFEPFKRLHSQQKYEGSGIGLATCKRIVEFHGWRIRAESDEGKGATFIISMG